ncbi:hypothetical protein MMC34_004256 [Xylographa carneopallida]|nr:hypothetical protein [Xylographa carneopallida]
MASSEGVVEQEPFPWHRGVYDAHCHPTDTVASLQDIPYMKARILTIMATRSQDQELVLGAADDLSAGIESFTDGLDGQKISCRVVPSFGWHPWFSHQIYDDISEGTGQIPSRIDKIQHYRSVITPCPEDEAFIHSLPEPRALSDLLATTKKYLLLHPFALVGEIGLDRSFRLPESTRIGQAREPEPGLTSGSRDGRKLSPHHVEMDHQRKILKAQLHLAGEMGRAVSVHGVAAHGILFDTLQETWQGHERKVISKRLQKRRGSAKAAHDHELSDLLNDGRSAPKPYPPRICMHSYSGPSGHLKQYLNPAIPALIFFSFSQVINFSNPDSNKAIEAIKAVPDDRILVESDLHCAGQRMDGLLEGIIRLICETKDWALEDGVKHLAKNYKHFVLGREIT